VANERVREILQQPLTSAYLDEKERQGWRAVAVEWERPKSQAAEGRMVTEVPYGLQIAQDCLHLEENPHEVEALTLMLDMIVVDEPLRRVAEELNRRGFRTRRGSEWTQTAIFDLLPRLVQSAPEIFGTAQWPELRKRRVMKAV
jgi:hypothetical protein